MDNIPNEVKRMFLEHLTTKQRKAISRMSYIWDYLVHTFPLTYIISGSNDNSIKIWDLETGECIHTLLGHHRSVISVCLTSDNKKIISGSRDKSIKIWDLETGECIHTLLGHQNSVESVCLTSDNKKIISGS